MLRISKITINGHDETCGQVNLIIGPNNSGKTTFLNELSGYTTEVSINTPSKWINNIIVDMKNYATRPRVLCREHSKHKDIKTCKV